MFIGTERRGDNHYFPPQNDVFSRFFPGDFPCGLHLLSLRALALRNQRGSRTGAAIWRT